jgi:hypothetical protein
MLLRLRDQWSRIDDNELAFNAFVVVMGILPVPLVALALFWK